MTNSGVAVSGMAVAGTVAVETQVARASAQTGAPTGTRTGGRRRLGLAAVAIGVALGLAACDGFKREPNLGAPVAQGDDIVERDVPPLTAAEVEIFLADSTLTHIGSNRVWNVYLGPDGSLTGHSETDSGAIERARGSWQVQEDGQLCRQWQNDWGGGANGCAFVYKEGPQYIFRTSAADNGFRRTRSPGRTFN